MENIIEKYREILEYGLRISVAIEKKDWEQISLFVSHRDELIQITNNFINNNKDNLKPELKREIKRIIKEIKVIDDANMYSIMECKAELELLRGKINLGHRALDAYKKVITGYNDSEGESV